MMFYDVVSNDHAVAPLDGAHLLQLTAELPHGTAAD